MRRRWLRSAVAGSVFVVTFFCWAHYQRVVTLPQQSNLSHLSEEEHSSQPERLNEEPSDVAVLSPSPLQLGQCIPKSKTDVDTPTQFSRFEFQPYWMKSREYWDNNFENRYRQVKKNWPQLPLKVIVIAHSHNDPGWLKTFESYYHYQTRNILNNMADKLTTFTNMTFIWTEVSFFSQWWQSAHPSKRRLVRRLLDQGRLEMATGGWVMTDEATSHLYGMLDQLIEGHQWLRNNVGVQPKTGWAVDPFGHGSTVPYLLKMSGVDGGTVIQRIHYAWKQWLAEKQMEDFLWRQTWDSSGATDMLVHNQPYDIYSIKHSCGPHPQVCLNFDFRKISGEFTEYSLRAVAIDDENLRRKAELLLEQYGRTGSLVPHNVVLVPLGDDFRYDHDIEWDQQYKNYKRLFDYINNNKKTYNAEIRFGTPSDYFKEVKARMKEFKTLQGDFFVYSDIFSEGRPAYWSGYFTTRPYWKILCRELEAELRSAEILYTIALNKARKGGHNNTLKIVERDYEVLSRARQNLALFQHHDAITGTSKAYVMHDYALKLFEAMQDSISLQSYAIQTLVTSDLSSQGLTTRFILPNSERESYEKLPQRTPINVQQPRKILVFNSLAQPSEDVITLRVTTPNLKVVDSNGKTISSQINPVWDQFEMKIIEGDFELIFIAELLPLTIHTFKVETVETSDNRAFVYCRHCNKSSNFMVKTIQSGHIQLENSRMKLLVDGRSGFLKLLVDKQTGRTTQCGVQFAAYPSAQFHSGAYLFMPDPNAREAERDILEDYPSQKIVIVSGPVRSELRVVYGSFLTHSIILYQTEGLLGEGVYMENIVDFEAPPKNRETELFMRIVTDVSNSDPPEFYTDMNGFSTQKRKKIERVGIEGNYFPVTTHAFIQDTEKRVTLLVDHAQGSASWEPGWLEVMLERRTLYDDSRGMGEGIVDNKRTLMRYWLLSEDLKPDTSSSYVSPSYRANILSLRLNYPPNVFVLEAGGTDIDSSPPSIHPHLSLFSHLPCDVHLLNLRTLSDKSLHQFPSASALMILHRQGFSCQIPSTCAVTVSAFLPHSGFHSLSVNTTETTLTGLPSASSRSYKSLDEVLLSPMNLVTLNVTFS